jgi:hypothetical protein
VLRRLDRLQKVKQLHDNPESRIHPARLSAHVPATLRFHGGRGFH